MKKTDVERFLAVYNLGLHDDNFSPQDEPISTLNLFILQTLTKDFGRGVNLSKDNANILQELKSVEDSYQNITTNSNDYLKLITKLQICQRKNPKEGVLGSDGEFNKKFGILTENCVEIFFEFANLSLCEITFYNEDNFVVKKLELKKKNAPAEILINEKLQLNLLIVQDSFVPKKTVLKAIIFKKLLFPNISDYAQNLIDSLTNLNLLKDYFSEIFSELCQNDDEDLQFYSAFYTFYLDHLEKIRSFKDFLNVNYEKLGKIKESLLFPIRRLAEIETDNVNEPQLENGERQKFVQNLKFIFGQTLKDVLDGKIALKREKMKDAANASLEIYEEVKMEVKKLQEEIEKKIILKAKLLEKSQENGILNEKLKNDKKQLEKEIEEAKEKKELFTFLTLTQTKSKLDAIENFRKILKESKNLNCWNLIYKIMNIKSLREIYKNLDSNLIKKRAQKNNPDDLLLIRNLIEQMSSQPKKIEDLNSKSIEITGFNITSSQVLHLIDGRKRNLEKFSDIFIVATGTVFLDENFSHEIFHGKNMNIFANEIVAVKNIEINVSGQNGQNQEGKPPFPDSFGSNGLEGKPGGNGESAGNIFIKTNLNTNFHKNLTQKANGGRGGKGQDGGDATVGRDGKCGTSAELPTEHPKNYGTLWPGEKGDAGEKGGDGGVPGEGGLGGSCGTIIVISGKEEVAVESSETKVGDQGLDGQFGKPADGGIGGTNGADAAWVTRSVWWWDDWIGEKGKLEMTEVKNYTWDGYELKILHTEEELKTIRLEKGARGVQDKDQFVLNRQNLTQKKSLKKNLNLDKIRNYCKTIQSGDNANIIKICTESIATSSQKAAKFANFIFQNENQTRGELDTIQKLSSELSESDYRKNSFEEKMENEKMILKISEENIANCDQMKSDAQRKFDIWKETIETQILVQLQAQRQVKVQIISNSKKVKLGPNLNFNHEKFVKNQEISREQFISSEGEFCLDFLKIETLVLAKAYEKLFQNCFKKFGNIPVKLKNILKRIKNEDNIIGMKKEKYISEKLLKDFSLFSQDSDFVLKIQDLVRNKLKFEAKNELEMNALPIFLRIHNLTEKDQFKDFEKFIDKVENGELKLFLEDVLERQLISFFSKEAAKKRKNEYVGKVRGYKYLPSMPSFKNPFSAKRTKKFISKYFVGGEGNPEEEEEEEAQEAISFQDEEEYEDLGTEAENDKLEKERFFDQLFQRTFLPIFKTIKIKSLESSFEKKWLWNSFEQFLVEIEETEKKMENDDFVKKVLIKISENDAESIIRNIKGRNEEYFCYILTHLKPTLSQLEELENMMPSSPIRKDVALQIYLKEHQKKLYNEIIEAGQVSNFSADLQNILAPDLMQCLESSYSRLTIRNKESYYQRFLWKVEDPLTTKDDMVNYLEEIKYKICYINYSNSNYDYIENQIIYNKNTSLGDVYKLFSEIIQKNPNDATFLASVYNATTFWLSFRFKNYYDWNGLKDLKTILENGKLKKTREFKDMINMIEQINRKYLRNLLEKIKLCFSKEILTENSENLEIFLRKQIENAKQFIDKESLKKYFQFALRFYLLKMQKKGEILNAEKVIKDLLSETSLPPYEYVKLVHEKIKILKIITDEKFSLAVSNEKGFADFVLIIFEMRERKILKEKGKEYMRALLTKLVSASLHFVNFENVTEELDGKKIALKYNAHKLRIIEKGIGSLKFGKNYPEWKTLLKIIFSDESEIFKEIEKEQKDFEGKLDQFFTICNSEKNDRFSLINILEERLKQGNLDIEGELEKRQVKPKMDLIDVSQILEKVRDGDIRVENWGNYQNLTEVFLSEKFKENKDELFLIEHLFKYEGKKLYFQIATRILNNKFPVKNELKKEDLLKIFNLYQRPNELLEETNLVIIMSEINKIIGSKSETIFINVLTKEENFYLDKINENDKGNALKVLENLKPGDWLEKLKQIYFEQTIGKFGDFLVEEDEEKFLKYIERARRTMYKNSNLYEKDWLEIIDNFGNHFEHFEIASKDLTLFFKYLPEISFSKFRKLIAKNFPINWLSNLYKHRITQRLKTLSSYTETSEESAKNIKEIRILINQIIFGHCKDSRKEINFILKIFGDQLAKEKYPNLGQIEKIFENLLEKLPVDKILIENICKTNSVADWDFQLEKVVYFRKGFSENIVQNLFILNKKFGKEKIAKFLNIFEGKVQIIEMCIEKFSTNEWILDQDVLNILEKFWEEDTFSDENVSNIFERHKESIVNGIYEEDKLMNEMISKNENKHFKKLLKKLNEDLKLIKKYYSKKSLAEKEKLIQDLISEYEKVDSNKKRNKIKELAIIYEAVKIILGYHPYDTQILAVLLFLDKIEDRNYTGESQKGRIGEISTGEGKTLIIAILAIYLALEKKNINVITSSPVLAEENVKDIGKLYKLFQINVENICDSKYRDSTDSQKQNRFKNRVLYADLAAYQTVDLFTNYLNRDLRGGRNADVFIVDEVDSLMLDKCCNRLYISHAIPELKNLRKIFLYIWHEVNQFKTKRDIRENLENKLGTELKYPKGLEDFVKSRIGNWINNAYEARFQEKNDNYILSKKDSSGGSKLVLMDKDTGVELFSTQYSFGLHQFLQLRHCDRISSESLKAIFISNHCYFKNFTGKFIGITGTIGCGESKRILAKTYQVDFFKMSRVRFRNCIKEPGEVCGDELKWLNAIKDNIQSKMGTRSLLVICENIIQFEKIFEFLKECGFDKDKIFPYVTSTDENFLDRWKEKGMAPGQIIISTNLAGRGTDLKIGREIMENGGLHVILTYLAPNSRVEKQALGRAARKGERGSTKIIICSNESLSLEEHQNLRDQNEANRLKMILEEKIPEIEVEEELFKKFTEFKKEIEKSFFKDELEKNIFSDNISKKSYQYWVDLKNLHIKFMENRWAFWLDSVHDQIKVCSSKNLEAKSKLFENFDKFKTEIKSYVNSKGEKMCCLLPTEKISLGEMYEENNENKKAEAIYEEVIEEEPYFNHSAYYYKGLVCFKKNRTIENWKEGVKCMKIARDLLSRDIQELQQLFPILMKANMIDYKMDKNIENHFTKQIKNEIEILSWHILEINNVIGKGTFDQSFLMRRVKSVMDQEEGEKLYNLVTQNEDLFKGMRLTKKICIENGSLFVKNPKGESSEIENLLIWPQEMAPFGPKINSILKNLVENKITTISEDNFQDVLLSNDAFWEELGRRKIIENFVNRPIYKSSLELEANREIFEEKFGQEIFKLDLENYLLSLEEEGGLENKIVTDLSNLLKIDQSESSELFFNLNLDGILINCEQKFGKISKSIYAERLNGQICDRREENFEFISNYNFYLKTIFLDFEKGKIKEHVLVLDAILCGKEEIFDFLLEKNLIKKSRVKWSLEDHFKKPETRKNEILNIFKEENFKKKLKELYLEYHPGEEKGFETYSKETADAVINSAGSIKIIKDISVEFDSLTTKYYSKGHFPPELLDTRAESFDRIPKISKFQSFWSSGAFLVSILGAAQIALGTAVLIASGGTAINLAMILISEGSSDLIFSIHSGLSKSFSWKSYGVNKAFSVACSVATGGLDAFFGGSVGKITFQRITFEIMEEVGKQTLRILGKEILKGIGTFLTSVGIDKLLTWIKDWASENLREGAGVAMLSFDSVYTQQVNRLNQNMQNLYEASYEDGQAKRILAQAIGKLDEMNNQSYGEQVNQMARQTVLKILTQFGGKVKGSLGQIGSNAFYWIQNLMKTMAFSRSILEIKEFAAQAIKTVNEFLEEKVAKLNERRANIAGEEEKATEDFVNYKIFQSEMSEGLDQKILNSLLDKIHYEFVQPAANELIGGCIHSGVEFLFKEKESSFFKNLNKIKSNLIKGGGPEDFPEPEGHFEGSSEMRREPRNLPNFALSELHQEFSGHLITDRVGLDDRFVFLDSRAPADLIGLAMERGIRVVHTADRNIFEASRSRRRPRRKQQRRTSL